MIIYNKPSHRRQELLLSGLILCWNHKLCITFVPVKCSVTRVLGHQTRTFLFDILLSWLVHDFFSWKLRRIYQIQTSWSYFWNRVRIWRVTSSTFAIGCITVLGQACDNWEFSHHVATSYAISIIQSVLCLRASVTENHPPVLLITSDCRDWANFYNNYRSKIPWYKVTTSSLN